MGRITPHLWYDREAREAAELYVATFPDSRITNVRTIHGTPSGDCDIVSFDLFGQPLQAISAGPYFKFTPAVSFLVACATKEEVNEFWGVLSDGGMALMPLDSYPFSELYGWTTDKYGLSWQVMYVGDQKVQQRITPTLMFTREVCGRAEEAMNFYTSVFPGSQIRHVDRYGPGDEPEQEGTVKHGSFVLDGNELAAMDSIQAHDFGFNEAISFMVMCSDQEEIDRYWSELSAVPEAEQCGWLKDKFGLSWQIVPDRLEQMMATASEEQMDRVTQAFLQMKKYDLAELERAYRGQ
ncbi:MAG TPA: VOC family protein [Actinomycetota bacterium]|nr:VOC family protein [Actinomycetota bacterium]